MGTWRSRGRNGQRRRGEAPVSRQLRAAKRREDRKMEVALAAVAPNVLYCTRLEMRRL